MSDLKPKNTTCVLAVAMLCLSATSIVIDYVWCATELFAAPRLVELCWGCRMLKIKNELSSKIFLVWGSLWLTIIEWKCYSLHQIKQLHPSSHGAFVLFLSLFRVHSLLVWLMLLDCTDWRVQFLYCNKNSRHYRMLSKSVLHSLMTVHTNDFISTSMQIPPLFVIRFAMGTNA